MATPGLEKGKSIDFVVNSETSTEIRQTNLLRSLVIRFVGTLTIVGGTAAGTVRDDWRARLFRTVRIRGDGNTMQTWYGTALDKHQTLLEPKPFISSGFTNDNVAAHTLETYVRVPFYAARSLTPDQSGFPAFAVARPELSIQWGAPADLVSGEDWTSATFTAVTVDVYEEPLLGVDRNPSLYARPLVYSVEKEITTSGTDRTIELDAIKPGTEILRIIVQQFKSGSGADAGDYTNDLIDNLGLQINGVDVIRSAPWELFQQLDAEQYNLSALQSGTIIFDAAKYNQRTEDGQTWIVAGLTPPAVLMDNTAQTATAKVRITAICQKR